jgi:hypothetical protein
MEVRGKLHAPAALPPGKAPPGTDCIGGRVGPRAGLDAVVRRKIPSSYRDSNPRSPSPQLRPIPLNYLSSSRNFTQKKTK